MDSSNKLYHELYNAFSNVANLDDSTVSQLMDIVIKTFGSSSKWRYHTDPEFRESMISKTVESVKVRRQQDPEYNEKLKEDWRQRARKYAQDPEKMAKKREYNRLRYQRLRQEQQAVTAI
jgi:hypothetical protein